MSQLALQLVGADLEQTEAEPIGFEAEAALAAAELEARRLSELAGNFALFGLRIDQIEWDGDSAEQLYVTEDGADIAPANDVEPVAPEAPPAARPTFTFPELSRRGIHIEPRYAIRLIQGIDWLVVLVTAQLAAMWGAGAGLADLALGQATAFVLGALSLKFGLWLTEAYRVSPARIKPERGIGGLALGAIVGLIVANVLAADAKSAAALAATLPVAAMLLAGIHAALAVWIKAAHRAGVFSETIVLVGANDAAQRIAQRAEKSGDARVVAVVDDRLSRAPQNVGAAPVGGSIDDLLAWEGLPHVDRIVITVTQKAEARVRDMIAKLRLIPNRVDLLLDYDTTTVRGRRVERFGAAAVACVSGRPHSARRELLKRAQDLVLGSLLLAAFALPMLAIAIAVKLDSRGPALYRQRRHGFNNRVITILKFRSMRHDPEAALRQVCPDDPRVTRIGAFLRRTSLDELPQLINVLRGEMSLVGPRPHAIGMKAAERDLQHIVAEYAHRHRVKPGITGWAQINGSRGPIETPVAVRHRLKLDLEYVSRASLWLDLQILARTAPALFGDNEATR